MMFEPLERIIFFNSLKGELEEENNGGDANLQTISNIYYHRMIRSEWINLRSSKSKVVTSLIGEGTRLEKPHSSFARTKRKLRVAFCITKLYETMGGHLVVDIISSMGRAILFERMGCGIVSCMINQKAKSFPLLGW